MELVILFIPTIIAVVRGKTAFGTFLVNLFLGYIPVVWIILLLYAIFKDT